MVRVCATGRGAEGIPTGENGESFTEQPWFRPDAKGPQVWAEIAAERGVGQEFKSSGMARPTAQAGVRFGGAPGAGKSPYTFVKQDVCAGTAPRGRILTWGVT